MAQKFFIKVKNQDGSYKILKDGSGKAYTTTMGIGLPIEIKTEEEAEKFLTNELNIGRLFVYLGETGKFNHNGIYVAVGKEEE